MTTWRKSTYSSSGGATCVEVGDRAGQVLVRDTKQSGKRGRTTLAVSPDVWRTFLARLR